MEVTSESAWIKYWRPTMAWIYAAICLFDFMVAPIMLAVLQGDSSTVVQWSPLTLRSGGIFHLSMGAIVAAVGWARSQEKIRYMEHFSHMIKTRTQINNMATDASFDDSDFEGNEDSEPTIIKRRRPSAEVEPVKETPEEFKAVAKPKKDE